MSDDGVEGRPMSKAIFTREFNWRRPKSRFSFNVKPSPEPQLKVHDLIDAAVAAGAATRWPPPEQPAPRKRRRKRS